MKDLLVQVDVGNLLRFKSCVLYTEVENVHRPLIHIEVVANVTQPEKRSSEVSLTQELGVMEKTDCDRIVSSRQRSDYSPYLGSVSSHLCECSLHSPTFLKFDRRVLCCLAGNFLFAVLLAVRSLFKAKVYG